MIRVLCVCLMLAAPAAAVPVDFTIQFSAQKAAHECISTDVTANIAGAPGSCGSYTAAPFATAVIGQITLRGDAFDTGTGEILLDEDSADFVSCMIGSERCGGPNSFRISADRILVTTYSHIFNGRFFFDLPTATGGYKWEDDFDPIFSRGSFALSDVTLSGQTGFGATSFATPPLSSMPLPAGAGLLLGGLVLMGVMRRPARRPGRR